MCVIRGEGAQQVLRFIGVGRLLGDPGDGFGGPRSVLDGFGAVLGWILGCVRVFGVSMEGLIFGTKLGWKTARPTQNKTKTKSEPFDGPLGTNKRAFCVGGVHFLAFPRVAKDIAEDFTGT